MKTLNRLAMFAVAVMVAATSTLAAEEISEAERDENAKQVAKAWLLTLAQGDTAVTTSLSAVPFSLDGKHKIEKIAELKSVYDGIVEKKGRRKFKPSSIEITESSAESVVVRITVPDDDEAIGIFVRPGHASRVVGFVD